MKIIFFLLQLLSLTLISEQTDLVNSNTLSNTIQCDFEDGFCPGWTDFLLGSFNWTIGTGSTPTSFTGPDYDHTFGENGEGKYAYAEASGNLNSEAWLKTPSFIWDQSKKKEACIQFWYYLYGEDIDKILVGMIVPGRAPQVLDSVFGNHGKEWKQKNISMTLPIPEFQVLFFARIKNGDKGDMAIDDVSITQGECPLVCRDDQFTCESSMKCIDKDLVCDGVVDCQVNNEDEVNCEERCADGVYCNGICVPPTRICDGEIDCPNREDEDKCTEEECDEDQFSCPVDDSGRFACVDFEHICDSVPDCPNGEDEIFCEVEFNSTTTKPTTTKPTTIESTTTKPITIESTTIESTTEPIPTETIILNTTKALESFTTMQSTTTEAQEPTTTEASGPTTTEAQEPATAKASGPTTEGPEPPTTTKASGPTTTKAQEPTTTKAQEPTTTKAPGTTTKDPEQPTTEDPEPPTTKGGAKVHLSSAISIFFFIFYVLITLNN